jgi:hypothetical protein
VLRRIGRIRSFDVSARISWCHSGEGTWAFSSKRLRRITFCGDCCELQQSYEQQLLELLKEVG